MNHLIQVRPKLIHILKVNSGTKFHQFFLYESINQYIKSLENSEKFGNILCLGANYIEAENLIKFPFTQIVLTGISQADDKTNEILKKNSNVSYQIEDIEKLSFRSKTFDIVFVKEALHHVPRPIQGLYEMLRVSKKAVIFIEPADSIIGKLLEKLNVSTKYEINQSGNKKFRDNFVFRWNKNEIIKILNSYYLESGYKAIFSNCWMSNRYNLKYPFLTRFFNLFGYLISFIPKNRGNYLICIIYPGADEPKQDI